MALDRASIARRETELIELIRASVRPIVTVLAMLATVLFIAFGVGIPDQWWIVVTGISAWWFSSRQKAATP